MKYKGKEIGYRPTISMVKECIKKLGFDIDANNFFKLYEERNWLTQKKKEPYSLEVLLVAYNSIVVSEKRKKGVEAEKAKKKAKCRNKNVSPNYFELLKDPRWQKRRLEIFQRDNWTCKMCGCGLNDGIPLNVHHYVYHKDYLPWEYQDKDLITLCENCHHKLHNKPI